MPFLALVIIHSFYLSPALLLLNDGRTRLDLKEVRVNCVASRLSLLLWQGCLVNSQNKNDTISVSENKWNWRCSRRCFLKYFFVLLYPSLPDFNDIFSKFINTRICTYVYYTMWKLLSSIIIFHRIPSRAEPCTRGKLLELRSRHKSVKYASLDSDDNFRSGCRNISQRHHEQSFWGLHSPGRSYFTVLRVVFDGHDRLLIPASWNVCSWDVMSSGRRLLLFSMARLRFYLSIRKCPR